MGLPQPYYRICRPFTDGWYVRNVDSTYLLDPRYAPDGTDFVRAFRLLEVELLQVFAYVEPADQNLGTYSHQLYQLLLRSCTEVESNAKAILRANGYGSATLTVKDYHKIERACRLSEYAVTFPLWRGTANVRRPFRSWQTSHALPWYQDYNRVKHDRSTHFEAANLGNALDAIAGLFALLFAQFATLAFDPYRVVTMYRDDNGCFAHGGCLLQITPPVSWSDGERYAFEWETLKGQPDPYRTFSF